MKRTTPALAASTVVVGALLALMAPLSASAHIEIEPSSTAAGSESVLTFSLPHGCDGSATKSISIEIPETIESVTPTVNPGWDVTRVPVALAKPIDDGHGNTITTRTGSVAYTAAAPMPDGLRTTFALSLPLPAKAVGTTLSFPVLQTCVSGQTEWNQPTVAGKDEPQHPAPMITVTAAVPDGDHAHGDSAEADSGSASTGGSSDDVLARVLGLGGLVIGAVGIVLAVTARRRNAA